MPAVGSRHGRSRRSCAALPDLDLYGLPEFGAEPRGPRVAGQGRVPRCDRSVPGPRPAPPAHRVIARSRRARPQRRRRCCRLDAGCSSAAKEGSASRRVPPPTRSMWRRADPARRVLLISTDPAHSLGDVLGQPLDDEPRSRAGRAGPTPVPGDRRRGVPRRFEDRYLGAMDGSHRTVRADPHPCPTRSMPFVR